MEVGAHIIARGLVQGVGFRYFILGRAEKYRLNGYAANLMNGDVEIVVEGDRSLVEEFIGDIKVGPRAAHVSDLHIRWIPTEHRYHQFEIR